MRKMGKIIALLLAFIMIFCDGVIGTSIADDTGDSMDEYNSNVMKRALLYEFLDTSDNPAMVNMTDFLEGTTDLEIMRAYYSTLRTKEFFKNSSYSKSGTTYKFTMGELSEYLAKEPDSVNSTHITPTYDDVSGDYFYDYLVTCYNHLTYAEKCKVDNTWHEFRLSLAKRCSATVEETIDVSLDEIFEYFSDIPMYAYTLDLLGEESDTAETLYEQMRALRAMLKKQFGYSVFTYSFSVDSNCNITCTVESGTVLKTKTDETHTGENAIVDGPELKTISEMATEAEDKLNSIVEQCVKTGMNEYGKEYALLNYVVQYTNPRYEFRPKNDIERIYKATMPYAVTDHRYSTQNTYSTIMTGWGSCTMQAPFLQLLLEKVGIYATTETSCTLWSAGRHMYNLVALNEGLYLVDVGPNTVYTHFNITKNKLEELRTEVTEGGYVETKLTQPEHPLDFSKLFTSGYMNSPNGIDQGTTIQDGNAVYFINMEDNFNLYKMTLDGTGEVEKIAEAGVTEEELNVICAPTEANGFAYIFNEGGKCYGMINSRRYPYGTICYLDDEGDEFTYFINPGVNVLKGRKALITIKKAATTGVAASKYSGTTPIISYTVSSKNNVLSGTFKSSDTTDPAATVSVYLGDIYLGSSSVTDGRYSFTLPTNLRFGQNNQLTLIFSTTCGRQRVATYTTKLQMEYDGYLYYVSGYKKYTSYISRKNISTGEVEKNIATVSGYGVEAYVDCYGNIFCKHNGGDSFECIYHVTDILSKETDESGYLLVSTAEQLREFAENVANGINCDAKVLVTNDIDMSGVDMIPIGTATHPYTGTFTCKYIIGNLNVTRTSNYTGLFGYVKNADITVKCSDAVINGKYYTGIIGYAESSKLAIDVCYSTITGTYYTGLVGRCIDSSILMENALANTVTGTRYVGGVAGYMNNETVSLYNYDSTVSGTYYVGGLIGFASEIKIMSAVNSGGAVAGTMYVGGLVGKMVDGSCFDGHCQNGTVRGNAYVGGIVGSLNNAVLSKCTNSAQITANASFSGGLVGSSENEKDLIKWSQNTGSVSGVNKTGGIVGGLKGSVSFAGSTGNVSGKLNVGGSIGYVDTTGSIQLVHSTGDVTGETNLGSIFGYARGTIRSAYGAGSVTGKGGTLTTVGGRITEEAVIYDTVYGTVSGCKGLTSDTIGSMIGRYPSGTVIENDPCDYSLPLPNQMQ